VSDRIDEELLERLAELTRPEVLEAALAVGEQMGAGEASGEEAESFLAEVKDAPYAALEEVEQLARAALVAAASDPVGREVVREVVDRVGQKAFIFGGLEIVAVAVVGVALLQAVQAKGRTSEEETVEEGHDDQGRPYVKRYRKVTYGPRLGRLLFSVFRGAGDS
jgi:hypothetical protein